MKKIFLLSTLCLLFSISNMHASTIAVSKTKSHPLLAPVVILTGVAIVGYYAHKAYEIKNEPFTSALGQLFSFADNMRQELIEKELLKACGGLLLVLIGLYLNSVTTDSYAIVNLHTNNSGS